MPFNQFFDMRNILIIIMMCINKISRIGSPPLSAIRRAHCSGLAHGRSKIRPRFKIPCGSREVFISFDNFAKFCPTHKSALPIKQLFRLLGRKNLFIALTKNTIRISFKLSSFVLNVFNRIEAIVIQSKKTCPRR